MGSLKRDILYFQEFEGLEKQQYYTNAMNSDVPMITDPYYDPTSGTIMSSCSTPIVVNGNKIGCVTVDIELTAITEIIGNIKVGDTGVGILTAADGLLIAGYDDEKVQSGANLTEDDNSTVARVEFEFTINDFKNNATEKTVANKTVWYNEENGTYMAFLGNSVTHDNIIIITSDVEILEHMISSVKYIFYNDETCFCEQ